MLKMNVCNMCKEVHPVRVLYVHIFVSVFNFLRWNEIIKYKKKERKRERKSEDCSKSIFNGISSFHGKMS